MPCARAQRGAALLTAMVIVTLVATLAGAMIWQQWRAVQVEQAERARAQAQWILAGAVDWARLILREDARENQRGTPIDHLGEPWAVPLAEAKLSTFLAADRENTEGAPEAFLSGAIVDMQSRYNLRNLIEGGTTDPKIDERILTRLFEHAGARADAVPARVRALRGLATQPVEAQQTAATPGSDATKPLIPQRLEQLAWLGLDAESIRQISPYVCLLPQRSGVNVNTASKEVLAAVVEGLDLSSAERLVQLRQRTPFRSVEDMRPYLPETVSVEATAGLVVSSNFFEVRGRLRLLDRVVEERALVQRLGLDIVPLRRERIAAYDAGAAPASP
jgi:general secretion pathway protein K